MSWYHQWSDGIKKRACRYLLQRYLGQFLEEKLNLDQLSVNIFNGTGSVTDVSLDVQALNEFGENKNSPVEFVDGFINEISVSIPWATLLTDSIFIEVSGLQLTIQPRQRVDNGESMLESMWSSVASSMQLAAECFQQDSSLQDDKALGSENSLEGLEIFAQTIESVLTRVKIKFVDSTLRLEHLPKEGKNGIALEIRFQRVEYCDETSCEDVTRDNEDNMMPMFSIKKFHCDGISFYTDEFPLENRTYSRSVLMEDSDMSKSFKEKNDPMPILICKLSGVQEIRLKTKRIENNSPGPKFDLEFSFGSLSLFLSPRQLHLLIEIAQSLSMPHIEDTSNVKCKKSRQRPMTSEDYRRIELDLIDQLNRLGANSSNKTMLGTGWVSTSVDESDEEFFPFTSRDSQSASLYSNNTVSWETSASAFYSSKVDSLHSCSSNFGMSKGKSEKDNSNDWESNGEKIAFSFRLASVAIAILHEDILAFNTDSYSLAPSSVLTMNNLSTRFFEQLEKNAPFGCGNKDFIASAGVFQNSCDLDHIRIMGSAIIVEGKEGGNVYNRFCNTKISVACLEIVECLFEPNSDENCPENSEEPQFVELLKFMKNSKNFLIEPHFHISNQPDLKIHIVQNKKNRPSHVSTKTEITFSIEQCWSEIDLSVYDRLSTVLSVQSLCCTDYSLKVPSKSSSFHDAFENTTITHNHVNLKLHCPFFVIKFRFPIPDLRPDVEKGRHPWWKRSIRKDVLYVNIVNAIFHTEKNYQGSFFDYKWQCNRISLLFQEGDSITPTLFMYSEPNDGENSEEHNCYELPRLSIKFINPKLIDEIEDLGEKDDLNGLTCSFMEMPIKELSPFSSRKFLYKSDPSGDSNCEGEEIIQPASKEELTKFINDTLENSKVQIDIVLPHLHVDFSSKHLYEVLYNRFCSDIPLWQSSVASSRITPQNVNSYADIIFPAGFNNKFSLCKSGLQLSDSDDEVGSSEDFHPTLLDPKSLYKHNHQSNISFKIQIHSGFLNMCPNLKEPCGSIIPDKHGQLQFTLNKAYIFSVNNYKGESQKNYLCFQVENISVMHQPIVENTSNRRDINYSENLKPIIYRSKEGMLHTQNGLTQLSRKADMFTVCMSTSVDSNKVKTVRIACGINGATLRYYVTPSEHSWLTQLMDFFDVVDYPVKGYDSPQAITELHLNLEESAVDYRPKYLKTQCVIYFGNFYISSNIAARTKTSVLRFIAEETNLFISNQCSKKNNIDLRSDYISVIDLGLFELSLRLSDQPNLPKVDLKASSDILNIRTCADSACCLAHLIKYYASNGDLNIILKEEENNPIDPYLEKTESGKSNASSKLSSELVELMEDAMKDLSDDEIAKKKKKELLSEEVELFLFPGEGQKDDEECTYDWGADCDSESEYCFLQPECTGILPLSDSEPIINILSDEPIQIIDNHFSVSAKIDHLLPPSNYPPPINRYTLSDMNIVWHMFGGNDFSSSGVKKNISFDLKEKKEFSTFLYDDINYEGQIISNIDILTKSPSKIIKQARRKAKYHDKKWYIAGGRERKHDVLMQLNFNKVRYQHEIYPDHTTEASRQVLLIHNFEINDKLKTSEINKFLYQYTNEQNPLQTNAHMVMIKALHMRPDTRVDVQETCLKISMLPLRFNIDQDSIEFLYNFLHKLSGVNTKENLEEGLSQSYFVNKSDEENLDPQSDSSSNVPKDQSPKNTSNSHSIFIRNFQFSPEVPIKIDYVGKRVDMSHGPMAGLMMGIGQLNCLQIKLKRLSYKQGLLGLDKLVKYLCEEWVNDITKTQIPNLIGGVGPMHALFQLFAGIKDLFWLPIEQYQKDGRIFRGIQRGANSFTTSTVIAALELTARIVQAIQTLAEAAFDMVSPGPSVRRLHGTKSKRQYRYSHPADIREGVTNAYALVKEGLEETAEALVRVASSEAEQKGAVGAVGGVLRQIPPSMVAPIIFASAATSNLLGGVKNQLAPDSRREASFKWKNEET